MNNTKSSEFHELLLHAERFCAYRERCTFEVRQKMKELGADANKTEKVIASLSNDDYLNDERFAHLFVSGKFRIKRWGKNKIKAELRMKNISDSLISKGLSAIDDLEYEKTIHHLIKKKEKEVKSNDLKIKIQKIGMYLLSKGYESNLIWEQIKLLIRK